MHIGSIALLPKHLIQSYYSQTKSIQPTMENLSFAFFMATIAIAAAIPPKTDRLCHNATAPAIRAETTKDAEHFHGPVPAVVAATTTTTITSADGPVHRTSDTTVDRMPREHVYSQQSEGGDHGKDESERQTPLDDYKYTTPSSIHH